MLERSPVSCCESRDAGRPANKGLGGRGRFGLLLYCEDGVPGRGLPLMSTGSYGMLTGGRDQSVDALDGVHGLLGEPRVGL